MTASTKYFSWQCPKCLHRNPRTRDTCRGWQCEQPRPDKPKIVAADKLPVREALLHLAQTAAKRQPYTDLVSKLATRFEGR